MQRRHVACSESVRHLDGRNGRLGSHLPFGDLRRGWDFVSVGHGDVPSEHVFRRLNEIRYDGQMSIEWEDAGMDRELGAFEALASMRKLVFAPPQAAFDAALASQK